MLLELVCRFAILIVKGGHGCTIHTYDVSMKERPKGRIATKLCEEVVKRPLQLRQKIVLTDAALCNNRSDNRRDLTFHVFPMPRILAEG